MIPTEYNPLRSKTFPAFCSVLRDELGLGALLDTRRRYEHLKGKASKDLPVSDLLDPDSMPVFEALDKVICEKLPSNYREQLNDFFNKTFEKGQVVLCIDFENFWKQFNFQTENQIVSLCEKYMCGQVLLVSKAESSMEFIKNTLEGKLKERGVRVGGLLHLFH